MTPKLIGIATSILGIASLLIATRLDRGASLASESFMLEIILYISGTILCIAGIALSILG